MFIPFLVLEIDSCACSRMGDESLTIREPDLMWAHVPCRTAHVAMGFRSAAKVSRTGLQSNLERNSKFELSLSLDHGIQWTLVFVLNKSAVVEIDCYQVLRELSDYLEADLTPQLRSQIEEHLKGC